MDLSLVTLLRLGRKDWEDKEAAGNNWENP